MKKIFSGLVLAFTILVSATHAQNLANDTSTLPSETRHHFQVDLPEQISFKVALVALDDWNDNDFFNVVNNNIRKHIQYFEDSINNNATLQNLLYIERKPGAGFEKLNFRQLSPVQSEIVFKDGRYYNLKNSMDSLHYTYFVANPRAARGAEDSLHQNLITITAKSLPYLNTLSNIQVRKVQQLLDSMVNAAKLKYRNYRSPMYNSNSSWSIAATGAQTSSFKAQQPFMSIINNFKLGVGYGAIVFNNSISPTMELSLGYLLKRSKDNALFVGFNYSFFSEINLRDRNNLVGYLPFHLEVGTIRNNVGLMQRKTSLGYGVMIKTTRQSGTPATYYLPSMQLNFALSNTISSSLIMASQLKKDAEHYVLGVSLKYNL